MTVYTPDKLLALWAQEKLTPEQAIGQMLQLLVRQQAMLEGLRQGKTGVVGGEANVEAARGPQRSGRRVRRPRR